MNYLILITSFLFAVNSFGQLSGTIHYTETIKLEFELPEGIDVSGMMSNDMSNDKVLSFQNSESVYRDDKGNQNHEKEITNDDGSFKMVFKMDSPEEILYTNLSTKEKFRQTDFMGKTFLIESSIEKSKWRLTNEKIKYLGYVCQKAERTEYNESEDREELIVAWFTSEIPSPIGPSEYNNLPGAVLMVNIDNGKTEIKATEVILEEINNDKLQKPSKGDKVSADEFEQIVEKKMKEMEAEYGGEGSFIIRG